MRSGHLAVIAAALLTACARDSAVRSGGDAANAPAEPLPRIVESSISQMDGAWGRGLRVRYETAVDITDVPALREEADSIWSAGLRDAAEKDHVCTVELKASTPTRSMAVPGTGGNASIRRNWSFVVRHDSAGAWRWLSDLNVPLGPCPS
ncbi:MAG TPA: hypothetical protein VFS20_21005 [Longimicrobium sp.]|nr:hypothetical protein [Longimicrobium sp.]